jgi:hypothetical protein
MHPSTSDHTHRTTDRYITRPFWKVSTGSSTTQIIITSHLQTIIARQTHTYNLQSTSPDQAHNEGHQALLPHTHRHGPAKDILLENHVANHVLPIKEQPEAQLPQYTSRSGEHTANYHHAPWLQNSILHIPSAAHAKPAPLRHEDVQLWILDAAAAAAAQWFTV